jgi:hypothetical protein
VRTVTGAFDDSLLHPDIERHRFGGGGAGGDVAVVRREAPLTPLAPLLTFVARLSRLVARLAPFFTLVARFALVTRFGPLVMRLAPLMMLRAGGLVLAFPPPMRLFRRGRTHCRRGCRRVRRLGVSARAAGMRMPGLQHGGPLDPLLRGDLLALRAGADEAAVLRRQRFQDRLGVSARSATVAGRIAFGHAPVVGSQHDGAFDPLDLSHFLLFGPAHDQASMLGREVGQKLVCGRQNRSSLAASMHGAGARRSGFAWCV